MRNATLPVVLGLVAALAAPAAAQDDADPGTTLALLRSDLFADVAWGAHRAGRDGLADALPLLFRQLGRLSPRDRPPAPRGGEDEGMLAALHVLDALVLLDARPPADLVLPHLDDKTHPAALVLLLRSPERHLPALLELFDRWWRRGSVNDSGLAVGNALATARSPGFTPRLLRPLTMRLTLTVRDPGDLRFAGASRSIRVGSGDGYARVPEGWPPYPVYRIETRELADSRLIAGGPRPVFYRREPKPGTRIGFGGPVTSVDARLAAREWLAALLGEEGPERLGIPETSRATLFFAGEETFAAEGGGARDDLARAWWRVVGRLVEAGLLSLPEARAAAPRIEVEVVDERAEPREPLPALPPLDVPSGLPEPD